jgi:hypothetical protein
MLSLPTNTRSDLAQALHDRRVVGRDEVVQDARGAGRAHAARAEVVLEGDGHAQQRGALARVQSRLRLPRHLQREFRRRGDERLHLRLGLADVRQHRLGQLDGGHLAGVQFLADFGDA